MKGHEPIALIALGFAAAHGINIIGAGLIALVVYVAITFVWEALAGKKSK